MASFYGSLDLLKFKGAKLLSGLDEKHPEMNYVCIPIVNYSGVSLLKGHDGNMRANVPLNYWPVSERYRQAIIANKQSRGEDISRFNPPSHQVEVSYSQEFREKALEAAKKRILTEHPDWKDNPEHEKELKSEMYNAVRIRLGNITAHVEWGSSGYGSPSNGYQQAPAAQNAQPWTPPTVDADGNEQMPYGMEDDDLPF